MNVISNETTHRVVVRSIGQATSAVHTALSRVLPLPSEQIVRCLYQAPSVLLDGLGEEQARTIGAMLAKTGLEVEVAPRGEALVPGGPDFEVAVHVGEVARFRAVAVEVARFLGCEPAQAVRLLCASPAVILGQVSAATVRAIEERLKPLGATVDGSRTEDALYDVFVQETAPEIRARVTRLLVDAGVPVEAVGPLCAVSVPRTVAATLYARLGNDPAWRLVDRAFQRYDLVLEAAPDTPEVRAQVVALSGMPEPLVSKVLRRLPVVLVSGMRGMEAAEALAALADVGAKASADLITLAAYDLIVDKVADRRAASSALAGLCEREEAGLDALLSRLPAKIPGPFGLVKAQWIAHELGLLGAHAKLEAR